MGFLFNPSILVIVIGVFVATSIFYRVSGWISSWGTLSAYALAVQERDEASRTKDKILEEAASARHEAETRISFLEQQLSEAQAELQLVGDASCRWSERERGVLNRVQPAPAPRN